MDWKDSLQSILIQFILYNFTHRLLMKKKEEKKKPEHLGGLQAELSTSKAWTEQPSC